MSAIWFAPNPENYKLVFVIEIDWNNVILCFLLLKL